MLRKNGVSAGAEGERRDRAGQGARQALPEAVVGVDGRVSVGVQCGDEVEAELVREAAADVVRDAEEIAQKLASERLQTELGVLELESGKGPLKLLVPGDESW